MAPWRWRLESAAFRSLRSAPGTPALAQGGVAWSRRCRPPMCRAGASGAGPSNEKAAGPVSRLRARATTRFARRRALVARCQRRPPKRICRPRSALVSFGQGRQTARHAEAAPHGGPGKAGRRGPRRGQSRQRACALVGVPERNEATAWMRRRWRARAGPGARARALQWAGSRGRGAAIRVRRARAVAVCVACVSGGGGALSTACGRTRRRLAKRRTRRPGPPVLAPAVLLRRPSAIPPRAGGGAGCRRGDAGRAMPLEGCREGGEGSHARRRSDVAVGRLTKRPTAYSGTAGGGATAGRTRKALAHARAAHGGDPPRRRTTSAAGATRPRGNGKRTPWAPSPLPPAAIAHGRAHGHTAACRQCHTTAPQGTWYRGKQPPRPAPAHRATARRAYPGRGRFDGRVVYAYQAHGTQARLGAALERWSRGAHAAQRATRSMPGKTRIGAWHLAR